MTEVFKHNWLIHRIIAQAIVAAAPQSLTGKLIDVGCGTKPYARMLKPYVSEHIGVDHSETLHDKSNIDRFGTAYKLPARDEEFDSALCTAVLEHLEDPNSAVKEIRRVLKPGGKIICTVPFIWHLHEEPRDFYRFTKYGLRHLFAENGFAIVDIKALSGFWVTFAQLFVYYLYRFRRGGAVNPLWWLIPPLGFFIQAVVYTLRRFDKTVQWTWMYMVVAKKT